MTNKQTSTRFSVDTKLFRELGELLVGRESTALAELVKNAYDADATRVRVRGIDLNEPNIGTILVEDDGVGMSRDEFERGFLRIGARTRVEGERRSARFQRRYTGAKGVGRLAAHKLAEVLEIESWRWSGRGSRSDGRYPAQGKGLRAIIDWSEIERHETLDRILSGLEVSDLTSTTSTPVSGTRLTLKRLRRRWTKALKTSFLSEVGTLVPLPILVEPITRDFGGKLLFTLPTIRDTTSTDPGFRLELEGELARSDELLAAVPASAIQVIEIDCDSSKNQITVGISPSRKFADDTGAERLVQHIDFSQVAAQLDFGEEAPGAVAFQARIYERMDNADPWPEYARGVRVYMEGFRVMPYGDATDDWLGIKEDYTTRARGSFLRHLDSLDVLQGVRGESAVIRPYQAYSGAVFLRQNAAPGLQMVVNREGFLPNATLLTITRIVRTGIDLATRVRYAATKSIPREREKRSAALAAHMATNVRLPPSAALYQDSIGRIVRATQEARVAAGSGNVNAAKEKLREVEQQSQVLSDLAAEAAAEQAMLRVLASLGTQLSAFSHEIGQLVPTASTLVEHLERMSGHLDNAMKKRVKLGEAKKAADSLLRSVERQAVYLIDVTGAVGRRRRSRLSFSDRLAAAKRLVVGAIEQRNISVEFKIPENLSSPPMFPAELTMVFSNLLTNAIKAAKPGGKILATGQQANEEIVVRLENTGDEVDLRTAERWFKPFESKTELPDAVLGQGMGLGLTITRSILDEYAARIEFVKPTRGFSTAVAIRFPMR